jgi:hypothetical protein
VISKKVSRDMAELTGYIFAFATLFAAGIIGVVVLPANMRVEEFSLRSNVDGIRYSQHYFAKLPR